MEPRLSLRSEDRSAEEIVRLLETVPDLPEKANAPRETGTRQVTVDLGRGWSHEFFVVAWSRKEGRYVARTGNFENRDLGAHLEGMPFDTPRELLKPDDSGVAGQ